MLYGYYIILHRVYCELPRNTMSMYLCAQSAYLLQNMIIVQLSIVNYTKFEHNMYINNGRVYLISGNQF